MAFSRSGCSNRPGTSALRGSGNTLAPAIALVVAALIQVPLSGALTLGWGPFPALGMRGAALSYVIAFAISSVGMAIYLWSSPLRPERADWQMSRQRFRDILRVGMISSLGAAQTVLTTILLTGFVAGFGSAAASSLSTPNRPMWRGALGGAMARGVIPRH